MHSFPTFKRGGVHPADRKEINRGCPIEEFPMPSELLVAMSQHLGAPAKPQVAAGDRVLRGQIIGAPASFVSAYVHSPATGTVKEIRKVTLPTGMKCDAVVIIPDAEQTDGWDFPPFDWKKAEPEALIDLIKEKGIVGMGGATFPAHVKLSHEADKRVEYLVVNCVECEPYLCSDYRLMIERPEAVLTGALIAARAARAEKIIVGVEANKQDAAEVLEKTAAAKGWDIEVKVLAMKYPQGDEKQLLKSTIDREIPSGKLPLDVGAVVCNCGSCNAIYEAVVLGKPLIDRIVSVSGDCILNPKNLLVPIGTKIGDLIAYCGGFKTVPDKIISGGPMMGFAVYDMDTPVTKGAGGLLSIQLEPADTAPQYPCIACGRCLRACPMGLQPNKMFRLIANAKYKEALAVNLMDCKECGCCAYVCPAHLTLVQAFKLGKRMGRKK